MGGTRESAGIGTPAGLRRAYLAADRCGPGQIHVRAGGSGPAVLLVPDSPGTGVAVAGAALALIARGYAVVAPDLLGAGGTTCAAGGGLERQSLLMQDVLEALGWPAVTVLADGAGAAIGLRLAADRPDLVTGVGVLSAPYAGSDTGPGWDGELHQHGEHLVRLWHELRDAATFSPWWQHDSRARRHRRLPGAGELHQIFADALPHAPAHRALAEAARTGWARLRADTTVATAEGGCAADLLSRLPASGTVTADSVRCDVTSSGPAFGYVDCEFGQLHVRICRPPHPAPNALPVLLLHANPGSSAGLETLLAAVGTDRTAVAVDLPGHGRSDPLPESLRLGAGLATTYAPLLLGVLDQLDLPRLDVYGGHTGAGLATELAVLAPHRIRSLVLDGVPLFDDDPELVESVLAHYFIDLTPDEHGGHLVRAWNLTWDMALWWPWFRHDTGGIRAVDAYPTEMLQRVTADLLRSLPTYSVSYRAAWQWAATTRLPALTQPVLVGSSQSDPLRAMTPRALALLSDASQAVFPSLQRADGPRELAEQIRAFTASLAADGDHSA